MTLPSIRVALLPLFVLLLPASTALGQEAPSPDRSGWEISPFIGGYDDGPEFGPADESVFIDPERNPFYGARIGYALPSGLFLEGGAGRVSLLLNNAPGTAANEPRDMGLSMYSAVAGYRVRLNRRIELFAAAGGGLSRWSPDGLDAENDFNLTYGAGTRVFLTDRLALRGDVRLYQTPDALADTRQAVGAAASEETFWGWASTAGISFFPGGPRDGDRDGVRDERDACPDTPRGVGVGSDGCPPDSDGDGVADHLDRCPGTPAGARVDGDGCALDGDGDGVADGLDRCPGTPAGVRVDGVGCALDGDGDGVPDGPDECPNTGPGTAVDEVGCPVAEAQRDLEEEGRFTMEAVHFDFDSARLRASSSSILDEVGRALAQNPDMRIRIEGHADSVGVAGYNFSLSERRARAVREYLIENFPELEAERLEARGYGESRPVADNSTEEGRQRNRRVEFVVIGGNEGG